MGRIRKAVVAAVTSAFASATGAWIEAGPDRTQSEIAFVVGTFIVTAFVVGVATWGVRNEGSDIGATGSTTTRYGNELN